MSSPLHAYHRGLEHARAELLSRSELRELVDPATPAARLHAFLIQWTTLSLQLQEPTEQIFVEASRRCEDLGRSQLSLTMLRLAADSIARYRLVANDTRVLVGLWNERQNKRRLPTLNLTQVLTQQHSAAVRDLHQLQRTLASSARPWTVLASIFEAEAMLASVAPRVASHAEAMIGPEVKRGMRCVEDIARLAHSGRLPTTMAELLRGDPDTLELSVDTGVHTLQLYQRFLGECSVAATNLAARSDGRPADDAA